MIKKLEENIDNFLRYHGKSLCNVLFIGIIVLFLYFQTMPYYERLGIWSFAPVLFNDLMIAYFIYLLIILNKKPKG